MLVLAAAPPHTFSLPISLNSLDHEGVRLLSPRDSQILQNQMQGPMIPYQEIRLSSSGSLMRTQDDTTFPFQTISSGAQLGRSGTLCIWGYLYFGSVVGPCLYLDECNDIYAIVWRGECKPTMYLFYLFITWVVWRLPHLRHCLQCGYASKSCFDTWEI